MLGDDVFITEAILDAYDLKRQAECLRRSVGCVLIRDGAIVGRGYNHGVGGDCRKGECPRGQMTYEEQPAFVGYGNCIAEHAETMAIREAGLLAAGALAIVTARPCEDCGPALERAGVLGIIVAGPDEP